MRLTAIITPIVSPTVIHRPLDLRSAIDALRSLFAASLRLPIAPDNWGSLGRFGPLHR